MCSLCCEATVGSVWLSLWSVEYGMGVFAAISEVWLLLRMGTVEAS